eukprot:gnl/MRDRNA2_/MRDRNA2_102017_c0_seq1.p1 gnl/MRDRNA2_/MRDRNA2_102017_c0~~gnl/MRDRNA2_/MRDRNA2_102017_c0_seq1.p1  ORF type:complete len:194 (+),score=35.47 gnl/MRDRNA2_/MRDRNA2_102017_c0_seq1:476-1057(+)
MDISTDPTKRNPQQAPESKRFPGMVKWYDAGRGMGIIDSPETRQWTHGEVVVQASKLKGVVPMMGDKCTFLLARGKTQSGWKAVEMEWQTGESAADRERKVELACANIQRGRILSFDEAKGFGFIRCDDIMPIFQKDIFFMKTQLTGQYSNYSEGMEVYFRMHILPGKGPQATCVSWKSEDVEQEKGKGKGKG